MSNQRELIMTARFLRSSLAGLLIAGAALPALAADHRDGPLATSDPSADINDVYVFMNPNNANEVIVIDTIFPIANFASRFSDAVDYRTHIDNGASEITI